MKRTLCCVALLVVSAWTLGMINADEPRKADQNKSSNVDKKKTDDTKSSTTDKSRTDADKGDHDREGASTGKTLSTDEFLQKASADGLAEVNLGQLAVRLAGNDAVRQFGQRMVTDHTQANQQLIALANQHNWTLAKEMDKKHQDLMNKLSKLNGADFDRQYMDHMVADHKEDVSMFEAQSKNAKDAALKSWAGQTLPVLREHLKMAQDVDKAVGGNSGRDNKNTDRNSDRNNDK